MKTNQIGKLPPRYSFLLNPYVDQRLSKCPSCQKPTHARKFALFIDVIDYGAIILGKTCKFCSSCEQIVVHQHELEAELAISPAKIIPGVDSKRYFVIGVLDRRTWQQNLSLNSTDQEEILNNLADFCKHMTLHVDNGGWQKSN